MRHKILLTLFMTFVCSTSFAIEENEYRFGIIAGNAMQKGQLADVGSILSYGLGFGYMFADDMLFEIDLLSGSVDALSQTALSFGIAYYYFHHNTVYYDVVGGMTVITNSLKTSAETLSGGGSGFYVGFGLDYDLGARFVAGFQARYNYAFPISKVNLSSTEVTVVDSYLTTLLKISYVF